MFDKDRIYCSVSSGFCITSPLANEIFGDNDIEVTGNASSSYGIKKIEISIGNRTFKSIGNDSAWSHKLTKLDTYDLEGEQPLIARVTDIKGNIKTATTMIQFNRTPPTVTVNNLPQKLSNNTILNLDVIIDDSSIESYSYQIYGTIDTDWKTNSSSVPIMEVLKKGVYTLEISVKNKLEVENRIVYSWEIKIGAPNIDFAINNNDTFTSSLDVNLTYDFYDISFPIEVNFSNDGINWDDTWYDTGYSSSISWSLGQGYGEKSVYMRFRDSANFIYEEFIIQDTITHFNEERFSVPDDDLKERSFGSVVDVSDDMETIVVGTINNENRCITQSYGSFYIYEFKNNTWNKTRIDKNIRGFAESIAISGDGSTIVVGSPGDDVDGDNWYQGSITIFSKTNGVWDGGITKTYDNQLFARFGNSVDISDDGKTIVTGCYYLDQNPDDNTGAILIYTKEDGTWDNGVKRIAYNTLDYKFMGYDVAISGDGSTIIATCGKKTDSDDNNYNDPIMYIFIKNSENGQWNYGFEKSLAEYLPYHSCSYLKVDLSDNGDIIALSAGNAIQNASELYSALIIYVKENNEWQFNQITGLYDAGFCAGHPTTSIAISSNGSRILVGTPYADKNNNHLQGSFFVFERKSSQWEAILSNFSSPSAHRYAYFGWDVAMSPDGAMFIIGCPQMDCIDDSYNDSFFIY